MTSADTSTASNKKVRFARDDTPLTPGSAMSGTTVYVVPPEDGSAAFMEILHTCNDGSDGSPVVQTSTIIQERPLEAIFRELQEALGKSQ